MHNLFLSKCFSKKIIALLILSAGFICGYVSITQSKKALYSSNDSVTCYAGMNIYSKNQSISMQLKYVLSNGKGKIIMRGHLSDSDMNISVISREVELDYQRKESLVSALVKSINKTEQDTTDDSSLASLFPDIWTEKGIKGVFYIYPQYPEGYVFARNFLPSFYCSSVY